MSAKSISIIGGADGPTSIFITTSVNCSLIIGVGVFIVLIAIGFYIYKKRRGGKQSE